MSRVYVLQHRNHETSHNIVDLFGVPVGRCNGRVGRVCWLLGSVRERRCVLLVDSQALMTGDAMMDGRR